VTNAVTVAVAVKAAVTTHASGSVTDAVPLSTAVDANPSASVANPSRCCSEEEKAEETFTAGPTPTWPDQGGGQVQTHHL
jgi:hypothetical protein